MSDISIVGKDTLPANGNPAAGRVCPLHYRYVPEALAREADFETETLYVVGGLYGNPEALGEILRMARMEQRQRPVRIVFNGDFNWFNVGQHDFALINDVVLAHDAILGNVELEIAAPQPGAGCGCCYPDYVSDGMVQRSNAIMERLQAVAAAFPRLRSALAALPMQRTVIVAGERIGILHGDPESLAGWRFSVENMPSPDDKFYGRPGGTQIPALTIEQVLDYFRRAQVKVFASTHTCLPFAQLFEDGGEARLIINNGSAGMPNFRDARFGVMTRISADPAIPSQSLYGAQLGMLRCDAIAIEYDYDAWLERFLSQWPEGSPAHRSYFDRLIHGPDFSIAEAVRHGIHLYRDTNRLTSAVED